MAENTSGGDTVVRDTTPPPPASSSTASRPTTSEPTTSEPTAGSSSGAATRSADGVPRIVVLGNSLAAGLGVDPEQAFPALLQDKIDSLGWRFEVVNAGISGETTAGGVRRIDWLLRDPIDVLVVELGGNDGLRGFPTEVTRRNLQTIIDKTRSRYPNARIVLAGMQVPPNLGEDYAGRFRALYPELARKNDVTLIPFLLEDVGGVEELNQADGIHPNARGHRIVARNVWDELRPVLANLRETERAASAGTSTP